jgi:hypothetical protein
VDQLTERKEEQSADNLTERKVLRRGLLAGLAGLGAAVMMHAKGASNAQAAPSLELNVTTNAPTAETRLTTNPAAGFAQAVFQVLNGGTAVTGVKTALTGISTSGHGLYAQSDTGQAILARRTGTSGTAATIQGRTRSASGIGVSGIADNNLDDTFGAGIGVAGRSYSGIGVRGTAEVTGSIGVLGRITQSGNTINNTTGVRGDASGATGIGVHGIGAGHGTGVLGVSNDGVVSPPTTTPNGNGPGVKGMSTGGPGVEGVSVNSLGVRGTSTSFVGIVGISTSSHGLYGSTNGGAGVYGIVAENLGANGPGLLITGSAPSQVYGGLQVFGVKNAVLKMQDGSFASVYCQESPEPYFEDFGRAQLVGGVANVPLEREFATLVAGGDYHVFTHPQGDTNGLFVSRQGPAGFEVRECKGGTGNIAFSYRIVTKRKDIEGRRFARVSTEAAEKVAGVRAMLSSMGTPGAPSPTPPSPAPFAPPANPVVPTPPTTNQQAPNPPQPGPTQPGPTQNGTTGIGGVR